MFKSWILEIGKFHPTLQIESCHSEKTKKHSILTSHQTEKSPSSSTSNYQLQLYRGERARLHLETSNRSFKFGDLFIGFQGVRHMLRFQFFFLGFCVMNEWTIHWLINMEGGGSHHQENGARNQLQIKSRIALLPFFELVLNFSDLLLKLCILPWQMVRPLIHWVAPFEFVTKTPKCQSFQNESPLLS